MDRVRYYHQEHDGGTLTDADISLSNLKGRGPAVVGTLLAKPPSLHVGARQHATTSNETAVLVQNTGDAPLSINTGNNAVQIQAMGAPNDTADFQIVSQNCSGATLPAGNPNAVPPIPRGSCVVNVRFRPSKSNYTSVARLQFTSGSDAATESVLLAARSNGDPISAPSAATSPSVLQLSVSPAGSFGTFVPGLAQAYTTALSAVAPWRRPVTRRCRSATRARRLRATSSTARSRCRRRCGARALALGDPVSTPYASLPATAGTPLALKSWSTPIAATPLTLGFRQAIGADRRSAGRHLQQDPDVHAVDHDPVSESGR